ncbi:MAG: SGNH/GDSL hydrolase family protein [Bacteroidales bacterium]|nr:SGNH/GDSL hydrolase family protein [Bacteroidales bacterium]
MRQVLLFAAIYLTVILTACETMAVETNTGENNGKENTGSQKTELTYLALGDSYTIGESVDASMRWPVQLVERLRGDSVMIADAQIIARTGWTTDELMKGIDAANPGYDYDLVSLLIGVNNQYRGRDIDNFRIELAQLMDIAIERAGNMKTNVIVLSIPDWGVMPFAAGRDRDEIAARIDAFNNVVREESSKAGLKFFDITGISRQAATDNSLHAGDGLHPSGLMYTLWVDTVYSHVLDLLQ